MQPNDQQGFYRPDQEQPAQPVSPPQPNPVTQPLRVDPTELQAILNEPAPVQDSPQPAVEPQGVAEPNEGEEPNENELSDEPVTWMAHEYLHHEKGATWFILFAVVITVLIGISVWTKAWSFTALIAVIAVVVVLYSKRPPRELAYSLTDDGLTIDNTLHKFDDFKSFGVIRDGNNFSVMLIPVQRFQPGITVYFPEESGEAIVDILGSRLPMKELHLDAIDRIVRMLRL